MSVYNDHVNAMLELLAAIPGLRVFPRPNDGTSSAKQLVPAGTPMPYVAVHFSRNRPDGSSLCATTTGQTIRAYAHCVGGDDRAARAYADRVAAAWLDVTPTVPGRTCAPIRFESSSPPTDTETSGTRRVELTEVYRLDTEPA